MLYAGVLIATYLVIASESHAGSNGLEFTIYIKMDRSTIVQAVSSEQFGKFLKDLILAFKNYSKEGIIAEGIETEKELRIAKETGNYLVQGMLLGEPKELK